MVKINEELLEDKLAEIERIRSWSPRVVAKLEGLIRSEEDFCLFRINPLKFGSEKNISEKESIDLFLYGVKAGLFEMNWQLLCPKCGDVVESFDTLKSLHSHYHCDLCQDDFETILDDFIEVSFTVSPSIREIVFHDPESLSIEDYFFKYVFSRGTAFPDGTNFIEMLMNMTKILTYIEPSGKKEIEIDVTPGYLRGYERMSHGEFLFDVNGDPKNEGQKVIVKFEDGKSAPIWGELSPGKIAFEFENLTNRRGKIFLIHHPHEVSPQPLEFEPFLTGKKLLTTQTFRDLFRTEIVQGSEGIGVKDITILFTDLKGSTALYDRIGDLNAFSLVRQHFDSLGKVVNNHSGAIVKTIGDAIMAAFLNPIDAVRAAFDMLKEIEDFNRVLHGKDIIIKIGIHKGPSIAVTLNERLDYFGQTVNVAARVQRLADANEIYLSDDVYTYPGVQELLRGYEIDSGRVTLKGIQEEVRVYKINRNNLHPAH